MGELFLFSFFNNPHFVWKFQPVFEQAQGDIGIYLQWIQALLCVLVHLFHPGEKNKKAKSWIRWELSNDEN